MENTSRVSMAALSNPLDISHEEARLRHADGVTPRTAFHVMPSGTVHDHFVERDGLRFAGTHLIIDLWQASNLDDIEVVETALRDAAAAAGATLLKIDLHSFTPSGGITGVAVLAESHISIHTWPERAYAAIDVFMCGDADPHKAIEVLRHAFGPRMLTVSERSNTMNTFQEKLYEHHSQVFTMDADLYRARTKFQDVLIFENRLFGCVMVLDGVVQLTERDNYIYHEMIAHVPLMAHGAAKRVLIIGGGDGGTLKEVLKHPVEYVKLIEIDDDVIELSKRFFPQVSDGAFEDRRVNLVIGDGVEYVTQTEAKFDAVIVDSTDPIGPGEQLFTKAFYERCRNVLRPGGMIALQSGAPFYNPEQLESVCSRLACSFDAVRPFFAPVPTYAGGMLALVAGGEGHKALRPPIKTLREQFDRLRPNTGYYTPEVHRAAFTLASAFTPAPTKLAKPERPPLPDLSGVKTFGSSPSLARSTRRCAESPCANRSARPRPG